MVEVANQVLFPLSPDVTSTFFSVRSCRQQVPSNQHGQGEPVYPLHLAQPSHLVYEAHKDQGVKLLSTASFSRNDWWED